MWKCASKPSVKPCKELEGQLSCVGNTHLSVCATLEWRHSGKHSQAEGNPGWGKRGVFKGTKQGPRTELGWGFACKYFQKLRKNVRGRWLLSAGQVGWSGWATHKQQYKQQMYLGHSMDDVIFHKDMALQVCPFNHSIK